MTSLPRLIRETNHSERVRFLRRASIVFMVGSLLGVWLERPRPGLIHVTIDNPTSLHAGSALMLSETKFMRPGCIGKAMRLFRFDDGVDQLLPSDPLPDIGPQSIPIPISSHLGCGVYKETKSQDECGALSGVFPPPTAKSVPVEVCVLAPEIIVTKTLK